MLTVPAWGIANLGLPELIIILLIVLLLFGARRLPEIFKAFGGGIKTFRDAQAGKDDGVDVTPKAKELSEGLNVAEAEEVKEKAKA